MSFSAALAVIAATAWLVLIAAPVLKYLTPIFRGTTTEVIRLIRRDTQTRLPFHSYTHAHTALWDRGASYAFVLLTLSGLALGLWRAYRTRRFDFLLLTFAIGALLYPASALPRATVIGGEVAGRAIAFVFIPTAFFMAYAIAPRESIRIGRTRTTALTLASAVLLYGGYFIGGPLILRQPGPFVVGVDGPRAVNSEGLAAARWMAEQLGPQNRFEADRINRLLIATYGDQRPVTELADGVEVSPSFLFSTLYTL